MKSGPSGDAVAIETIRKCHWECQMIGFVLASKDTVALFRNIYIFIFVCFFFLFFFCHLAFGKASEHRISLVRSTWCGCPGKIAQAAQTCSCGVPISRSTSAKMQSMTWGSCQRSVAEAPKLIHWPLHKAGRRVECLWANFLLPTNINLMAPFLPSGLKSHPITN